MEQVENQTVSVSGHRVNQWLVVDKDYGDYYYHPNHADTNGVIDTFYYGQTANLATATATTADSAVLNIDENRINRGSTRYIWVRDDDGFVAGGRFVVYADSAPPKPGALNAVMSSGNDSIRVMWGVMLDAKDSINTEVKLEICYGADCTPSATLKDWTPASEFAVIQYNGDKRSFVFGKTQSGDMRWRVLFRDKRGTVSASDPNSFTVP